MADQPQPFDPAAARERVGQIAAAYEGVWWDRRVSDLCSLLLAACNEIERLKKDEESNAPHVPC